MIKNVFCLSRPSFPMAGSVPDGKPRFRCGRSTMVVQQPSKLNTRVRFPSPAPINQSAGKSVVVLRKGSSELFLFN